MKILPINIYPFKNLCNNTKKGKISSGVTCSNPGEFQRADYRIYKYSSNINYSFLGNYKPISSLEPNYDLLNCDYSDVDEFSELFSQKINSQLRTPSLDDVKALCTRLQEKTGANKEQILNILNELTQFSNFEAVNFIQNVVNENPAHMIGMDYDDISSNAALNYFAKNKELVEMPFGDAANSLIVLDGIFLKQLRESKKNGSDFYKYFISNLNNGSIKLANLKSWDIKCSDNIYRSAAFLYGTGQLEELALDVIKRVQNGEKLNDIFYTNIENELFDILSDDISIYDFDISRYEHQKKQNLSEVDIYNNLKNKKLSPEDVKKVILAKTNNSPNEKETQKAIMKYLDIMSAAYSFDSMADSVVRLHDKINELYGDKVVYSLFAQNKSPSLINHLYAKINNINPNKFFNMFKDDDYISAISKGDIATVMLDDVSASGATVICDQDACLLSIREHTSAPLSPAVIAITDNAYNRYRRYYRRGGEFIFSRKVGDLYTNTARFLDNKDIAALQKTIKQGYDKTACSIVFPYIIPDNCSDISAMVMENLLIKNRYPLNKLLKYYK